MGFNPLQISSTRVKDTPSNGTWFTCPSDRRRLLFACPMYTRFHLSQTGQVVISIPDAKADAHMNIYKTHHSQYYMASVRHGPQDWMYSILPFSDLLRIIIIIIIIIISRTQVVPVVLGALGTVHAGIARWLDIIPGHHNLQHLQKAVLLGSARILRKVMSSSA